MAIDVNEIYSVSGAVKASTVGEAAIRDAIESGALPARKFGPRTTRIKGKDLKEWYDAQPLVSGNTSSSKEEEKTDGSPPLGRAAIENAISSAFR